MLFAALVKKLPTNFFLILVAPSSFLKRKYQTRQP
jgi:hypothetical protein